MGKLVIIRGPSGSGKSTVANALFKTAPDGTALIQQDYYRFMFKPAGGAINSKSIHKLVKSDVLICLKDDYDVIAEGIFMKKSWAPIFQEIFAQHPSNNFIFTYDISFKETIKRHRTKPNKDNWSEGDMKGWYKARDFLGYDFEYKLPEDFNAQKTLKFIIDKTGTN